MEKANLDSLDERTFEAEFLDRLAHDDGSAAQAHLAAGRPIYYHDPNTSADLVIKLFPDGTHQLVRFDLRGEHVVGGQSDSDGESQDPVPALVRGRDAP
ncbi:hypothetical protein [Paraburkholderia caledonica]|uniref:hypothetical protein n=1 Tax=Paraburkholderia caledonica TaxID=134536 RepID=UPI0007C8616F|nr:hypothetical protein [Paraburkholderia caledonica]